MSVAFAMMNLSRERDAAARRIHVWFYNEDIAFGRETQEYEAARYFGNVREIVSMYGLGKWRDEMKMWKWKSPLSM